MKMNQFVKWAAVGVLALATIPTVGMARTRASLPSAPVTQTPDSPVGIKSTKKVSSKHVKHKTLSKASKKHTRKASHQKALHKASKKHTHKKSSK